MSIRTEWPPEKIEALKRYWADGLTCSEIGNRIGKTRNAVIGKATRLGLPRRAASPAGRTALTRRQHKIMPKARNKPFNFADKPSPISAIIRDGIPIPDPKETDVARIAFVDLEAKHCRFIATKEPAGPYEPQFCGADRVPGTSYCEDHVRRCFSVPPPRRPAPAAPVPAETEVKEAA